MVIHFFLLIPCPFSYATHLLLSCSCTLSETSWGKLKAVWHMLRSVIKACMQPTHLQEIRAWLSPGLELVLLQPCASFCPFALVCSSLKALIPLSSFLPLSTFFYLFCFSFVKYRFFFYSHPDSFVLKSVLWHRSTSHGVHIWTSFKITKNGFHKGTRPEIFLLVNIIFIVILNIAVLKDIWCVFN